MKPGDVIYPPLPDLKDWFYKYEGTGVKLLGLKRNKAYTVVSAGQLKIPYQGECPWYVRNRNTKELVEMFSSKAEAKYCADYFNQKYFEAQLRKAGLE